LFRWVWPKIRYKQAGIIGRTYWGEEGTARSCRRGPTSGRCRRRCQTTEGKKKSHTRTTAEIIPIRWVSNRQLFPWYSRKSRYNK
jgi:hypothetical protein